MQTDMFFECIFVGIDWYYSRICCGFYIQYDTKVGFPCCNLSFHLVCIQCKKDPFFRCIVLSNLFLSFSFQQLGRFFLCRRFYVTHMIIAHKHFTIVTVPVTQHVGLSRFVLFTVVGNCV